MDWTDLFVLRVGILASLLCLFVLYLIDDSDDDDDLPKRPNTRPAYERRY